MNEGNTDLTLVKQVQLGNKQAFNMLVMKYQYKVVSIAMKYVSNESDAQDIAQETFIKAYRAIGEFRGDSSFFTWIYRIAINTAVNFVTTAQRKSIHIDVDSEDINSYDGSQKLYEMDNPENLLEGDETKKVFLKALNSLPSELKQALILRELEEMSYEDMALTMNCPIGTVRSRIFRAREILESQMSKMYMKNQKA